MKNLMLGLIASAALSVPMAASAAPIVLTFEGVGDLNPVGDFYIGGAGPNYGISFSPDMLALVDADAGGGGNFANEPSPDTVVFFLDADQAIMNVAAGFTTGLSFFYSAFSEGSVRVYSGLDATGSLLASRSLAPQFSDRCVGVGDPEGVFCNWTRVIVTFAGAARSVVFGGTLDEIGFDDITLGLEPDIVPEPSSLALLSLGLLGLGFGRLGRRR